MREEQVREAPGAALRGASGPLAEALERVRRSEERLRALVTATADMIYRMSPDWTLMYQLDGRGVLADTELPSVRWQETYLFEEDRPAVLAAVREAIRTRSVFQLEHRVRRADGSEGWTFSRAVPVLDPAGHVVEWFGAASDITDRRLTERSIRERLEELEMLYRAAPIGLAFLDPDLRFIRINERLAEINGLPAASHIGRTVRDLVPSIVGPVEAIRDRLSAGEDVVEALISGETVARPGVLRHWEERWSAVRDASGALRALSVAVLEVTDRQRAETSLRESEERLRLAAGAAGLGAWDLDLDTGCGRWDAQALAAGGLDGEDDAYDLETWLRLVHPEDREATDAAFRASVETGGPYRVEFRGARPAADGGERWLWSTGVLMRDEAGRPRRAVGFLQDVTERKRAERLLQAQEEKFRASQELAQHAFTILRAVRDPSGAVTDFEWEYANPVAVRLLGNRSVLGARLLERLPGNRDHPALFPRYVEALRSGRQDEVQLRYVADDLEGWFANAVTRIDRDRIGVAFRDVTEQRRDEDRRKLLLDELNHRVKNTLAVVQGVARSTFRSDVPAAAALTAFEGRLRSLSAAHDLLTRGHWEQADLQDVVAKALGVAERGRIAIAGPPVAVGPSATVSLSLALHELATNAVKYGALSVPHGRVAVDWTIDAAAVLRLTWTERDGPTVRAPTRRGFGSRVLERALASEPDGGANLQFAPEGVVCTLTLRVVRPA